MAVGDVNSNKKGTGARYNDNKVRYDLIPTHLLKSTAEVFAYGARKYAAWNWAKGMQYSVVIGCLKRHLAAIERGEDLDQETGFRHIGHLICNAIMLEHYMNMSEEDPQMKLELDDRPTEWFNAVNAAAGDPELDWRVSASKLKTPANSAACGPQPGDGGWIVDPLQNTSKCKECLDRVYGACTDCSKL